MRTTEENRVYMRAYYAANKERLKAQNAESYARHRNVRLAKASAHARFVRTGCSPEMLEKLLREQNGLCAICSKILKGRDMCADHCHKTGVVRGLLCRTCNSGIGQLSDDPNRLERAAQYLRRTL
jgi:hypothetical protein